MFFVHTCAISRAGTLANQSLTATGRALSTALSTEIVDNTGCNRLRTATRLQDGDACEPNTSASFVALLAVAIH